jgi:Ca2+ transporting ATPase
VLARSTPEEKFALVVGLQEIGLSIAVTADGLNDAKALK